MEPVSKPLYKEVSNTEMRLGYCEYCGSTPGYYETHHVKTRGSGGTDIRANKINLGVGCGCHPLAQQYKIKPYQLIIAIARREKTTVTEIYEAIGWPVHNNIDELEQLSRSADDISAIKTLEDLISLLITSKQEEQEQRFLQGEIINAIVSKTSGKEAKTFKWLSSETGWSPAYIRSLHKTYLAFPDEGTRVPTLTWSHHKLAAATESPVEWIERAAGKNALGNETGKEMSTRELRRAIIEKDEIPTEDPADDLSMKGARKALESITLILEQGGKTAEWLRGELQDMIKIDHHPAETGNIRAGKGG